jgi:hypothetical protein
MAENAVTIIYYELNYPFSSIYWLKLATLLLKQIRYIISYLKGFNKSIFNTYNKMQTQIWY